VGGALVGGGDDDVGCVDTLCFGVGVTVGDGEVVRLLVARGRMTRTGAVVAGWCRLTAFAGRVLGGVSWPT